VLPRCLNPTERSLPKNPSLRSAASHAEFIRSTKALLTHRARTQHREVSVNTLLQDGSICGTVYCDRWWRTKHSPGSSSSGRGSGSSLEAVLGEPLYRTAEYRAVVEPRGHEPAPKGAYEALFEDHRPALAVRQVHPRACYLVGHRPVGREGAAS
jgi:hypothetical protein